MSRPVKLQLAGAVVIVTGASRGIGPVVAEAFARRGARLVLAARNQVELEAVAVRLRELGGGVLAVATDVGKVHELERLVARAEQAFGRIDVVINNAGLQQVCFFEQLTLDEIGTYIDVNLTAALCLARLVLPGMLGRGAGHIVNMASVAGFGAAAYGETYGATKAGLVGFTRSMRASLKTLGSPVSASVVCPSFVAEAGMFADLKHGHALEAPPILGTCTPQAVADAVIRVIERDEPERFVGDRPLRIMFSGALLFPRLLEWLSIKLGVNTMFLQAARDHKKQLSAPDPRARELPEKRRD